MPYGFARNDVERVMQHYNVSQEEAEEMLNTYPIEQLLPPRGTGRVLDRNYTNYGFGGRGIGRGFGRGIGRGFGGGFGRGYAPDAAICFNCGTVVDKPLGIPARQLRCPNCGMPMVGINCADIPTALEFSSLYPKTASTLQKRELNKKEKK